MTMHIEVTVRVLTPASDEIVDRVLASAPRHLHGMGIYDANTGDSRTVIFECDTWQALLKLATELGAATMRCS